MMSQNTLSVKTGIHSIMVDVMKYRLLFSTILYRDLIVYYSKQSFVCMCVTKLELGNEGNWIFFRIIRFNDKRVLWLIYSYTLVSNTRKNKTPPPLVPKLLLGNADSPEAPASILKIKLINISENRHPFYNSWCNEVQITILDYFVTGSHHILLKAKLCPQVSYQAGAWERGQF